LRADARGFTLLEIIISLAIAALGIAAVAKATGSAATVAAQTRERMVAVWVAGNRLSELRIQREWPELGARDTQATMGGRSWYVTRVVAETDNEAMRRVEIEVYLDSERTSREYALHGYVSRYERPQGEGSDDDLDESGVDQNETVPLPGEGGESERSPAEPEQSGTSARQGDGAS